MRQMKPVKAATVRTGLGLTRAAVAREAQMQAGVLAWIESGRFIPYSSQLNKVATVFRNHGWKGDAMELLEEVE